MKATINPLALSSLLKDLSVGPSEMEGMLLGSISRTTSTTVGDHDGDQIVNSLELNITGHFTAKVSR